jgi:hypothetical protein
MRTGFLVAKREGQMGHFDDVGGAREIAIKLDVKSMVL